MHKSVLLNESIEKLNIKENGVYVDGTLGYGGHSSEILKRIKKGFLYSFDMDDYACKCSLEKLSKDFSNFEIIKANFVNLEEELNKRGITRIDGIVFDLGVSSPQLDIPERGFSYHNDAPLDMRMDTDSDFSAYNVVNEYSYDDLVRILRDYGEEKYACSIAKNIVKEREKGSIDTTLELVDIIKKSMPYKAMREGHPARRSFQAIRIEVNHELDVLKIALESAIKMLNVGGRISVITFHSLEDRIVKDMFNKYSKVDSNLSKLPFVPSEFEPKYKTVLNITPSKEEINENSRARSSRLRVIERIKE
mgnify:FL=1